MSANSANFKMYSTVLKPMSSTRRPMAGPRPPFAAPDFAVKSVVHCVFSTAAPQGTIYSAISDWLNEAHQSDFPVVPYLVHDPKPTTTCVPSSASRRTRS